MGALLLLSQASDSIHSTRLAFAPILAFDRESGLGGKTPARIRQAVQSKFASNPDSATKLYLRLVGLTDLARAEPAYALTDLAWGLEALGNLQAAPDITNRTRLFIGSDDPLVSASATSISAPHLTIIPGTSHDFRILLPRVAALESDPV